MKKLLVVLGICFISLFSFMGISEAAWELSGNDPDLGPFWYDPSSVIAGKQPGSVCYKQMVKRPDGKGGQGHRHHRKGHLPEGRLHLCSRGRTQGRGLYREDPRRAGGGGRGDLPHRTAGVN